MPQVLVGADPEATNVVIGHRKYESPWSTGRGNELAVLESSDGFVSGDPSRPGPILKHREFLEGALV
jgi:hypothetical protein